MLVGPRVEVQNMGTWVTFTKTKSRREEFITSCFLSSGDGVNDELIIVNKKSVLLRPVYFLSF